MAAWMSGNERMGWMGAMRAYGTSEHTKTPQGIITHPSGEHIVAELGSEMAKNGNMVSNSHSLS